MPKAKQTSQLPPDFSLQDWLKGRRIVPGRGNPLSKLWLIGEAPGEVEEIKLMPFVGPSGKETERMLSLGGITSAEMFIDNVVPVRPPRNKLPLLGVPPEVFYPALAQKLEKFRPNCVIAAGGTALRALCGVTGVTARRGSILHSSLVSGIKVVPMIHPSELFKDWALRTLMIFDIRRAFEESKTPDFDLPVRTYIIRPSLAQVVEACDEIKKNPVCGVDIETSRGRISCIGLSCSKDWAICIPLERRDGSSYWTKEEEAEIFHMIDEIFSDEEKIFVLQNHPFDFSFLYQYHLFIRGQIWDIMTMHNLLWPDMKHGLHVTTSLYTREPYYKDEGKGWVPGASEDTFWTYNCKDVCVTIEIFGKLLEELKRKNLLEFYELHYRRQQPALLSTQLTGWRIWERRRARQRKTWEKKIAQAHKELAGVYEPLVKGKGFEEFNVNSYPQMTWLLYEHLKLPVQRDRRTQNPTTNEDALEKLYVKKRHPVLLKILELRGLRKYMSSYLNVKLDPDERIRCSFGHTDFGRLKATKFLDATGTNLQTLPEVGRAFFIAD